MNNRFCTYTDFVFVYMDNRVLYKFMDNSRGVDKFFKKLAKLASG
jgi:hypothetical protein